MPEARVAIFRTDFRLITYPPLPVRQPLLRFHFVVLIGASVLLSAAACSRQPGAAEAVRPLSGELAADPEDDPSGEVARLIAEYNRGADEARRIEIIYELCLDGSTAARRTLAAIYRTSAGWRVKTELLRAIPSVPDGELTPLADVLDEALQSPVPMIRDAALDALHGFTHPQLAPLWRRLLTDPDPSLREEAQTMLEAIADAPAR